MHIENPNVELANALAPVMDVSSAEPINLEFIDKVGTISRFANNFYKRE